MSKITDLRAHRNTLAKSAQDLNAKFPADQRMPQADAARLDELLNQIEAVDADLAREHRAMQLMADDAAAAHNAAMNVATVTPGKQSETASALRAYFQGGIAGLSDAQRADLAARQNPDIRNAMSTTTTTEGGYTTAVEYMKALEVAMKSYGGLMKVAQSITTATGTTMNFPTADATAEVGEIVGQNVAVTAADTAFGNITLDVFKYSSKSIALPFELIQDSFLDIETYIQTVLAARLGRKLAQGITTGTGTGEPRGIVTAVGVGKAGATGQTLTVTYDDLVDLEHSIDPAYRSMSGVGYLMSDAALRMVRKVKDSQNRPVFVPGYEADAMINGGAPDRLMGRPIYIDQGIPAPAASAKSILFGKLDKYALRRVMDLTVFRMTDSAYTLKGQVGFVAFQRMGGNLIDVGGAVKAYQHSAT